MRHLLSLSALLLFALPVLAQDRVITDDEWCESDDWNNRLERYCEVQEFTLAADRDVITVDGGVNGGIKVTGWERNEILVRAKVSSRAGTDSKARELVDAVDVKTGSTIEADVPKRTNSWRRGEGVSVSFQVFVPEQSNLDLETHNGGVSIKDVEGEMTFAVLNGGVALVNLAGDVEGHTTNGGLAVHLTGDRWDGEGMNVKTTNGGVSLMIPEDYSAQLETGTVNGQLRFDIPVTVKGRIGREISTTLGDGGQLIRVQSTNGGVVVGATYN